MSGEIVDLEELMDLPGNRTAIGHLVDQLNKPDGVIPVVGWGLSPTVGVKRWRKFLKEQWADMSLIDEVQFDTSDRWDAAESVFSHSSPLLMRDAIASEYGWHRFSRMTDFGAAALLPYLTRQVVITTAIDNLLEAAFEQAGLPFEEILMPHPFHSSRVLKGVELRKPSGDANRPETLVVTKTQRDKVWGLPPSFVGLDNATDNLVGIFSLLFIGYDFDGPSDPLTELLRQKIAGGAQQIHYAIIPDEDSTPAFKRNLADMNVRCICFPRRDYEFIGPLLRHLAEQVSVEFRRIPLPDASAPSAKQITAPPETVNVAPPAHVDLPPLEIPEGLTTAAVAGECVLFVGSGLSARAGLPTWTRFVNELLDWSVQHKVIDPRNAEVQRQALEEGEANAVADNVADLYNLPERKHLLLEFCRSAAKSDGPLPEAYRTLLRIPFCGVLTTNFDDLLWRAYQNAGIDEALTPLDSEKLHEALAKNRKFLLKLYGTLDRPETAIVAPAEYDAMLRSNVLFLQFMEALFFSRTILFVGTSLEGIVDYLRGFRFSGPVTRQHYALVAVSGTAWKAKADVLARRYNINVLPFPLSPNYPEVDSFLQELAKTVGDRPQDPAVSTQAATPGRLRKVQLRNIGPFESLDIDLEENWMMLLGDNGVGKSSILKAIGVAIVGAEAREYASRIVRAGQSSASVTLITDRNPSGYVTEILKRDLDAEVVSRPSRPLEPENWVALGFPPLRTVSWNPSQGPLAGGKGRPTAEDVLPLIRGEADPRLDKLKQWIVNLDSEDKKQQAAGNPTNTAARILTEFFEVVGKITEEFPVTRGDVTSDYRIFVNTPDGPLPIESLSQGLTSLYSWVGILLQRLYEIRDPLTATSSHAIVLMDEIDAHMHPAWQRILVHRLKGIFPNLQVIGSTHSPLIVAGMSVKEITRLERQPDGKVVVQAIESDMMMGRADQLLTSNLFGLSTTMDPTTVNKLERYQKLLVIPEANRKEGEEEDLELLREELNVRIPVPQETPPERRAMELVKMLLKQNVGESYPEMEELIVQKAEQLLGTVIAQKEQQL